MSNLGAFASTQGEVVTAEPAANTAGEDVEPLLVFVDSLLHFLVVEAGGMICSRPWVEHRELPKD